MRLEVAIAFFFLTSFPFNVKLQFRAQTIKKGVEWFRTHLEIQTRNGSKRAAIPALPFFFKIILFKSLVLRHGKASAIRIKDGFVFFNIEVTTLRVWGLKTNIKWMLKSHLLVLHWWQHQDQWHSLETWTSSLPFLQGWTHEPPLSLRRQISCYNQHNYHDHFEDDLSL